MSLIMEKKERKLTGKPSVDRPWMQYYPQMLLDMISLPNCTIREYLEQHCAGMDVAAIDYYGEEITWKTIFAEAKKAARGLRAAGFKEGDQIPVFLRLVPDFITLLLAAEEIGASLLCRDNTLEENAEAVLKSGAKVIFAHDFLSQKELKYFCKNGVEKVVLISPLHYGKKEDIPSHIQACLNSYYPQYPESCAKGSNTMTWEEFIEAGEQYEGEVAAPADVNRPLYRAYTSGSTGPSKQVVHSAYTMLGIVCQMNFYGSAEEFRPNWMITCLPPSLVAVVVSMILMPLTSNKLVIMDPFCFESDVDLELMRYKANNWSVVPMFLETLMKSERITSDYDMSHFVACGIGCEAINNNQLRRGQEFFDNHGCKFRMTTGYGCSEAGSNVSLPMAPKPLGNGNVGVPMPLSVMSIFKPGTQEELSYNQIGEICKTGPGNMLGYDDPIATAKALQLHDDGMVWLHMGDLGYMDEDGVLYTLTRGESPRFGGGDLAIQPMENRVADANIEGIKDEFFVNIPDQDHSGCFIPYLYVVLEDGYTVDAIREQVDACLEEYMRPAEIIALSERPFWHFKTNRIGLTQDVLKQRADKNREAV